MCSISVEPRPSTILRPDSFVHAADSSPASTSAADTHRRRLDKSQYPASGALTRLVYTVGTPKNTVGRNCLMTPNTAAGSGRPGNRTLEAPAANGNVSELPKPYAKKIFGTEKQMSSGCSLRTWA